MKLERTLKSGHRAMNILLANTSAQNVNKTSLTRKPFLRDKW